MKRASIIRSFWSDEIEKKDFFGISEDKFLRMNLYLFSKLES